MRTASAAAKARGLIAKNNVQVLLADTGMPGEEGRALIRRMHELERCHHRITRGASISIDAALAPRAIPIKAFGPFSGFLLGMTGGRAC